MPAIVLDSSSDLPQSSEPCGSCSSLYPSVDAWTSSVLAPGAQEELYDGRDIHVETRLRGLYGLAQDDVAAGDTTSDTTSDTAGGTTSGPAGDTARDPALYWDLGITKTRNDIIKFTLVAFAVGYFVRGVGWNKWGVPAFETPNLLSAEIIVPVAVAGIVATAAVR
jgi:hypothetical protein